MNDKWLSFIYQISGQIYVPNRIKDTKKSKILHISDTPYHIYAPINKLINAIKPDYIIHTGDMVDDIKLEMCHSKVEAYKKSVARLIRIFECSGAQGIYIALGNHDDREFLKYLTGQFNLIEENQVVQIDGMMFELSHKRENIKGNAEYNLYGHSKSCPTQIINGRYYLNGIQNIHVILYPDIEIHCLPYPSGTNDARMNRGRTSM